MNARLDSMVAEIEPYMTEYRNRWPFVVNFNNDWDYSIQLVRDFIQLRPQYMNQHLLEMFGTTFVERDHLWKNNSSQFFLDQNWPNPVSNYTKFRFFLPYPCQVTLTLHNLAGQEVDILVDSYFLEGEHTFRWNTTNIAPGTYFYRITAGEFTETRKMIILR